MKVGDPRANARITLRNLIAARWVLIALAAVAVAIAVCIEPRASAGLLPRSEHPGVIIACLMTWSALNLASTVALRRDQGSVGLAGAHLLVDAVALTLLLGLSGGPANPFTILYFLPITLATQVSPRWTWILAGVCVACFAGLFVLAPLAEAPKSGPAPITEAGEAIEVAESSHGAHGHAPAAEPPTQVDHSDHGHLHEHSNKSVVQAPSTDHAAHFEGHQRGMWIAFGIVGVLITVFVHRTALALALQREELARLRRVALEDRHLTAVGTLAAGAAHELGTPLATISVLAGELPYMSKEETDEAGATIRDQLGRCKMIVARMASPELRISALGAGESWQLATFIAEIGQIALDVPLHIEVRDQLGTRSCRQPFEVLTQLLRELISNAAEACRRTGNPGCGIEVELGEHEGQLVIEVIDHGVGMDAEALNSAFDPFHTTRPEGQGMGLGLYLARAHLRQLGGTIELESEPGRGTTARVELPFADSTRLS